ncbi:hypothetical protein QQ045_001256 [Rhodiola kirilowii]
MKRYQKIVQELEHEKQSLQKDNEELKSQMASVLTSSDGGGQKVKEYYLKKLTGLEDQVSELKRKLESQSQLSCQKPKRDDAMNVLQDEIAMLKAQKAELQRKMKEESVHFRLGKAVLEKEVLQLKKDIRVKDYKLDKLVAFSLRLKMVLQRKVEEAFMATKRLNDLFESRKASPHEKGVGAGNIKGEKDQDQAKKEKNDAKLQIRGICSKYEKQLQEISGIANGKNELKNDTEMLDQIDIGSLLQDIDNDCQKKDLEIRDLLQEVRNNHRGKESEIRDLKEQVAKLSSMVRQLDMEKEPRKRVENSTLKGSSTVEFRNDSGSSNNSESYGRNSGLSDVPNTTGLPQSEGTAGIGKNSSKVTCCSCSSKSLCKTNKCNCRATGGSCGTSCGCAPSKCANRETVSIKLDRSPEAEVIDITKDSIKADNNVEPTNSLASHGAILLESAFIANTSGINNNGGSRIPLSDVGNKQVCFISAF